MLFLIICWNIILKTSTIPGLITNKYCISKPHADCFSNVKVLVNSLYSQRQFITLPISSSGLCGVKPEDRIRNNIGQNAFGEKLNIAPFEITFGEDITCKKACQSVLDLTGVETLMNAIMESFQHEWIIDDVPVLTCGVLQNTNQESCGIHFHIGCTTLQDKPYPKCERTSTTPTPDFVLFNHMKFEITYRVDAETNTGINTVGRIIKVRIFLTSQTECGKSKEMVTFAKTAKNLTFPLFYSVIFKLNNSLTYMNRFDYIYSNKEHGSVRWLDIIFSIFFVLLLALVSAYPLSRSIHSDISRYTELLNTGFDAQDDYGWKLLKGDIFRVPKFRMILAVSVGNGFQITAMVIFSLLFPLLGFFSEYARGSLITCLIVTYILLGATCGYISAAIYKFFDGDRWKLCVIANLFHPAIIFAILVFVNTGVRLASSGSSIPFLTLLELFALWVFVSLPLNFIGAAYGFKRRAITSPVKKNLIPHRIPRQSLYTHPFTSIIIGSLICFIAIYLQLHFIVNSIWLRFCFIMFGFLFAVTIILIIVCAEISFAFCYIHLCAEDYRWQWRSFLTVSFTAVYFLVYLIFYHAEPVYTSPLGSFVFFGYSSIMVYMMFLACGSIGFLATFFAIRKMFASIKVE